MKFTALSGGIPMGAAHYLIEDLEGKNIAFDCGTEILRGGNTRMPPITDKKVDLLCVSHGHLDHVGGLAYFAKHHPETKFLGTKVTRRFAEMQLWDSLGITAKKIAEGKKIEHQFIGDDIRALMNLKRFGIVHRPEWFSPWPDWMIRFRPNGHINGSACIDIQTPNDFRMTFSVDTCFNNQPTIAGAKVYNDFRPYMLFVEGTYGDRTLPDRQREEERFIGYVKDVLQRGGFALVPSFGIGGVNIALTLALAGIPTYIDGMIRTAADIINMSNPWSASDRPFVFTENLQPVANEWHRQQILKGKPCAIVTTHGMLEFGPVWSYLPHILGDHNSAVLIPGYQAEETGGYQLLRLERGQALERKNEKTGELKKYQIYCDVEKFYLSGHASGREIADYVQKVNPWEVVILHASYGSYHSLKKMIKERLPIIKVHGAFNGRELVDEWI